MESKYIERTTASILQREQNKMIKENAEEKTNKKKTRKVNKTN